MAKRSVKDKTHSWSEGSVFEALKAHYCDCEKWVLVPQIPDATSFNKCRTCDAMAFHCWKSEGIAIHGFEIKVARGDWLKEIQQPEKSAGFISRCHYWWIAAPEGVVNLQELPATWGLRVVSKDTEGNYSSRIKRPATFNAAAQWDVHFLVALVRCCHRQSPEKATLDEMYRKAKRDARQEVLKEKAKEEPWEIRSLRKQVSDLKDQIAKFESTSGIKIDQWGGPWIGEQVKAFHAIGDPKEMFNDVIARLEGLLKHAKILVEPTPPPDPKPIEYRAAQKKRDAECEARGIGQFDHEFYEEPLEQNDLDEILGENQVADDPV